MFIRKPSKRAAAVASLLGVLTLAIARRRETPRRLTLQAREEVLAKVQGWLRNA